MTLAENQEQADKRRKLKKELIKKGWKPDEPEKAPLPIKKKVKIIAK